MIANSNGHDLYKHLIAIGHVSEYLANKLELSSELCKDARHAGFLHDIGKSDPAYQAFITNTTKEFSGVHHHELSWLYLVSYTHVKSSLKESFNRILNAVYWHHAKPLDEQFKSLDTSYDMLKLIDQALVFEQIRLVVNKLKEYDDTLYIDNDDFIDESKATPLLYTNDQNRENRNAELIAVRSCVIAADRIVSKLSKEDCDFLANNPDKILAITDIKNYNADIGIKAYTVPYFYKGSRFDMQAECASKCILNNTVNVNGPAGLGKTLIGVLSVIKSGKRTIWVCPRNTVAESVFESIKTEINNLNVNLSVELYLASERRDIYPMIIDSDAFTSDIVVTNIDNLLKPMVSNEIADRLYYSLMSNIIFDEYHEFISEAPLFASFINLMRLRNRLGKKLNTVLLSATPTNMYKMWDDSNNKTVHLPEQYKHYTPAHDKPYKIELYTTNLNDLTTIDGGITVFNSIGNAQLHHTTHNTNILAHSKFIEDDKKEMLNNIYKEFGKNGTGVTKGLTVSSAPILQAAMDISFTSISASISSIESLLQMMGRGNRWGELDLCTIRLSNYTNRSESSAIKNMTDSTIRTELWNFIQNHIDINKMYTIAELYILYNKFYAQNDMIIFNYIQSAYTDGMIELQTCYPVKPSIDKDSNNKSSSKSLRTPDGSYYITVKNTHTDEWTDSTSQLSCQVNELYGYIQEFNDSGDMSLILKQLARDGYTYFEKYNKGKSKGKYPTIMEWKRLARNRETPLPVISFQYNKKMGMYKTT